MNEKDLLSELAKDVIFQAQEKVTLADHLVELFHQIDHKITDHFKNNLKEET